MTPRTLLALTLAVATVPAFAADPAPAKPAAGATAPKPKPPEKPKPPAYTTVEQAGPDYALQGEYGAAEADKAAFGVQVISLGDGKFKAVVFPGGLPGAGWSGDKAGRVMLEGKRDGATGPLALSGKGFAATTTDGKSLAVKTDQGQSVELAKVERKSPTIGAKPPEGAVVLFDGTSLDKWQGGKIVDGNLAVQGGGEPKTKDKFGDFTMHVEFMSPFMPTAGGQGRGNSGVYIQNRYEVQVLDSFALEGVDNECGGLYKNAAPKVNMCLPPLQWQTYDIDFTAAKWNGDQKTANAKITVRHNGVVIHQDQEIKNSTGGGEKEAPTPSFIKFQDHGNPVFYRNVWIVSRNH
ncbi:MAG: DUF1080 domain-containing protein [Phycisphaerae bacterium]